MTKEVRKPCDDCENKPCENNPYYNPDQECWKSSDIASLLVLGGQAAAELIDKLIKKP